MMPKEEQSLCIHDLEVQLQQKEILKKVNLSLRSGGQICGLIGPNGAGKSTLFKCIMGFERRYRGKILLGEQSLDQLAPHKRSRIGLGYLPQESWLFEDFSVWQNLEIFAESDAEIKKNLKHNLEAVLHKMDISHLAHERSSRLSGGEKRRLEFARTLLYQPQIILLDEPFTGIDPITINEISHIIQQLKTEGVNILISDHQAEKILNMVDWAFVLYKGEVLAEGQPCDIRSQDKVKDLYLGWD
jgi:lipopolysaccharide export system ATP-binding protein